jgi:hypothetical protein
MKACGEDYENIEHVLWQWRRYDTQRLQLRTELEHLGAPFGLPDRDLLGGPHWEGVKACSSLMNGYHELRFLLNFIEYSATFFFHLCTIFNMTDVKFVQFILTVSAYYNFLSSNDVHEQ